MRFRLWACCMISPERSVNHSVWISFQDSNVFSIGLFPLLLKIRNPRKTGFGGHLFRQRVGQIRVSKPRTKNGIDLGDVRTVEQIEEFRHQVEAVSRRHMENTLGRGNPSLPVRVWAKSFCGRPVVVPTTEKSDSDSSQRPSTGSPADRSLRSQSAPLQCGERSA